MESCTGKRAVTWGEAREQFSEALRLAGIGIGGVFPGLVLSSLFKVGVRLGKHAVCSRYSAGAAALTPGSITQRWL